MKQTVIVIGGGISGLATLHFLKKKYADRDDLNILLLERAPSTGGVLTTEADVGARFETGGNAFINNQPLTFDLIEDLNLSDKILYSNLQNKRRYFCIQNKLYPLPQSPMDLINFPLLEWRDKWSVLSEWRKKSVGKPAETMDEFLARRFTRPIAELFGGAMINGIFAGDSRKIVVKRAFPKIYQYEHDAGSVIKGMIKGRDKSAPKRMLCSFTKGMGMLTQALKSKYAPFIHTNQEVVSISKDHTKTYTVNTPEKVYRADHLFLTLPAYRAASVLSSMDSMLAELLTGINYAPVALVGLVCAKTDIENLPMGFGYLKPPSEGSPILGVLFEDQIFNHRTQSDQCLFRLMIGGMHHPNILKASKKEFITMARRELEQTMGFKGEPYHVFFKAWNRAIPQYDLQHDSILPQVEARLEEHANMILGGNYVAGVSVNDCIKTAYDTVSNSTI